MIPLRIKTHYSIGRGYCKAEQILEQCINNGYSTAAIADLNSLGGSVEFADILCSGIKDKEGKKQTVKPIIGLEISTVENDGTLLLFAKNLKGWEELVHISSIANSDQLYKDHPRIDFKNLTNVSNLICITGYPESYAANAIFDENAHTAKTVEDVQTKLNIDCFAKSVKITEELQAIFGKENVFIGVSIDNTPQSMLLTDIYRNVAIDCDIKCVALHDINYVKEIDYIDHYVPLCSNLGITIKDIQVFDGPNKRFFQPGNQVYYLPTVQQMLNFGYKQEEIDNTYIVANLCEEYKLTHAPRLPKFEWTDGMSEFDYLRHLCRQGWKRRINDTWDLPVYIERIKYELDVIDKNNLSGYFLIVQDFINYAKSNNILIGPGRGSAGGCLISYLTGITEIDPVKYNLTFSRFYNEGRNSPGNISLPDIDTDVPVLRREEIMEYLKIKYGYDRVAQMATYAKLQGKGAIKEVLRINNYDGNIDLVTAKFPDKAKIEGEMEEDNEDSTIMWILKYTPEVLEEYCKYENGSLTGSLARYIEQAIRIEGTIKSRGKHPAGVIISPVDLKSICPMMHDPKGKDLITELDMEGGKKTGLTKLDVLGLATLDKLSGVRNLVRYGKIEHE